MTLLIKDSPFPPVKAFLGSCYESYALERGDSIDEPRRTMMLGGNAEKSPVEKGMERDCLAGNGAPYFLKDRLMEQSDAYRMWKCDICGLPVVVQKGKLTGECRICGLNRVSKIKIPYGTKLIMQELMAMNIVPRIFTTPHGEVRVKPLDDAGREEIAKLRAEAIKESKK